MRMTLFTNTILLLFFTGLFYNMTEINQGLKKRLIIDCSRKTINAAKRNAFMDNREEYMSMDLFKTNILTFKTFCEIRNTKKITSEKIDSFWTGTVLGEIYGDSTTITNFIKQDSIFYRFEPELKFVVVSYELVVTLSHGRCLTFKNDGAVIPERQKKKLTKLKHIHRIFIQEVNAKLVSGDNANINRVFRCPTKIYTIIDE